ncbi:MAG: hypothetical protein VX475_17450, partial [Myxococcota bacterium]|nr:hypothetical protein [Myxococcota bacterium]
PGVTAPGLAHVFHFFDGAKVVMSPSTVLRRSLRALVLFCGTSLALIACGDPTDRPEDCTINEYFDEGDRLCISCPALLEPTCREGCGFVIVEDFRGCPSATCDETCSLCDEGTSWSEETLACEMEPCAPGEYIGDDGACTTCEAQQDPPQDCEDSACSQCSLVSIPDDRGCPVLSCALCQPPDDGSATVDEVGRCLENPEES